MANKSNKEQYIQFCLDKKYLDKIPLFAQAFWLDAVAENWDVCLLSESDKESESDLKIVAVLPYCWKGNLITKRIYLPDLSFYQSVIFFEEVENKNEIIQQLFQQLPKTIKSYFKFLPEYNKLDLSTLHYEKEDYSTYIINKETQELSLSKNHRRNIQKGIVNQYIVEESQHIEQSFSLLTSTFERQKVKSKISFDDFKKIHALAKKHNSGKTIDCLNSDKKLLASVFIVFDSQSAYYLLGGYNTEFKNSGAMTFLLNDLIQSTLKQHKDFNFCGSSKKSIATFFEGFGATKTEIAIWKRSIL